MKRIIVTILSLVLGAIGYTVVDKTIETRVSDLESKVSCLEEIVELYHQTTQARTTTRKTTTAKATVAEKDGINVKELLSEQQILGYRYEPNGDYYYTDDKECWQSNAGYNEIYDNMAGLIMMNIDQIRIRFTYEKKDWMIQFWKGQYGNLLIGAEIGVYTVDEGSYDGKTDDVNRYNCADKEDWLQMEMTCYWKENNKGEYKKAFSREYDYYWWSTGFVKGQLTKYTTPRSELKLKARITFKSTEMADLFVQGLVDSDFIGITDANQLVDDSFYQKDADVWLLWTTKYHDAFVGYEETDTTTSNPQETTHYFNKTTTYISETTTQN